MTLSGVGLSARSGMPWFGNPGPFFSSQSFALGGTTVWGTATGVL